jgi:hypothetical protein
VCENRFHDNELFNFAGRRSRPRARTRPRTGLLPSATGFLAHTKQTPSGTLQSDYVQGHMEVRGERAVSYEPLSSLDKDKDRSYLTECVHQSFSESQLPYKIVNLLFTITDSNMKLTVWWGC